MRRGRRTYESPFDGWRLHPTERVWTHGWTSFDEGVRPVFLASQVFLVEGLREPVVGGPREESWERRDLVVPGLQEPHPEVRQSDPPGVPEGLTHVVVHDSSPESELDEVVLPVLQPVRRSWVCRVTYAPTSGV